ncbi:glycosyltransferase [Nocardia fluminea]|uniref:UDP:flavonoid glycosyltransferase YjiC (YdhE family) n=1 Tax=Nocardia fluminea TaxID=134984 RepID=A0A2N3WWC9_9NOCA|nr:glycosyltransferase [Nocardia fluminea]PKV98166.1 UDP:flavonoid glycosyltransferase YjiC (YdhE family) [Nocardia fluminea]
MRALLAFTGSRGDAQPGILLARALRERGHDVTLALAPNLVASAHDHQIPAVPFGCDTAELLDAQRADHRFADRDPRARLRALFDLQRRGVPEQLEDLRALAPGHDLVVAGMAGEEAAESVAQALGLPFAAVHFFPIQPNDAVPVAPMRWAVGLPGFVHRWGWSALARARAAALASVLPTRPRPAHSGNASANADQEVATARIQAYDHRLFPGVRRQLPGPFTGFMIDVDGFLTGATGFAGRPPAGPHNEPETAQLLAISDPSSATTLFDTYSPSSARLRSSTTSLESWLDAGTAPIYVGFGSMDVGDPAAFVAMVREVCAGRGRRLLLASGWATIAAGFEDTVAIVGQVDHARVLPRCVAAVHHGGAGTTAAALRAGVPQVICSVQADQPYWGQALRRLGLAATMPAKKLTAERLDALLDQVSRPDVIDRAASYAADFATDGVERAADAVEALLGSPIAPELLRSAGRHL